MANKDRASTWLNQLHAHGYRLTTPRQTVVEVVATSHRILNPAEVYGLARARNPKIGLVTVYRTLEKLEELGMLQRVHQPSSCQGFIATSPGHQHLLICMHCGLVEYFDGKDEKLDHLITNLAQSSGFQIQEHWLQFFGFCETCLHVLQ